MKTKKHLKILMAILALSLIAASCVNSSQLFVSGGKAPLFISFGVR